MVAANTAHGKHILAIRDSGHDNHDDHDRSGGQTIEAIGQIHRIGHADNEQIAEHEVQPGNIKRAIGADGTRNRRGEHAEIPRLQKRDLHGGGNGRAN